MLQPVLILDREVRNFENQLDGVFNLDDNSNISNLSQTIAEKYVIIQEPA